MYVSMILLSDPFALSASLDPFLQHHLRSFLTFISHTYDRLTIPPIRSTILSI